MKVKVPREGLAIFSFLVIVLTTIILTMVYLAPMKHRGDEKLELSLRPGWIMEISSQGEVEITFSGDKPFSGKMIFQEGGEDFVSSMEQNFTYETRKMVNSPVSVYFKDRQWVNVTIEEKVEDEDESKIFVLTRPSDDEIESISRNMAAFLVFLMLVWVTILILI